MYFSDEVRVPGKELPELPDEGEVSDRELSMAQLLIESMESEWDPDRYHDTHREKVEALIEEKRQGREIVIQEPAEPAAKVVDLMEASTPASRRPPSPGRRDPRRRTGQADAGPRGRTRQEEGRRQDGQAARPGQADGLPLQGVLTPGPAPAPDSGCPTESVPARLLRRLGARVRPPTKYCVQADIAA